MFVVDNDTLRQSEGEKATLRHKRQWERDKHREEYRLQSPEIKKLERDGHKAGQHVFESNLMQWASQQRPDTQGGGWQMSSPNKQIDTLHIWALKYPWFKPVHSVGISLIHQADMFYVGNRQVQLYFYRGSLKCYRQL